MSPNIAPQGRRLDYCARTPLCFLDSTSTILRLSVYDSDARTKNMPAPTDPIPDAELQVLKLLWATESLTARELAVAIYRVADNSTVGTVQKLLQRLEKKGC